MEVPLDMADEEVGVGTPVEAETESSQEVVEAGRSTSLERMAGVEGGEAALTQGIRGSQGMKFRLLGGED